ncbi:MAG: glutaredoxin family protein [Dehalococcoidales bacterium]|nr:glutaredoxin family protein [Dehalococcoidales bacterium]
MALQHVEGKQFGDVKIYALSTCPWCKKTKKLLDDLGIEYYFTDVDLLSDQEKEEVMETVRRWNPNVSFPTIVVNDSRCIIGFREDELREALDI